MPSRPDTMERSEELGMAHERLRLATAAYAEMISGVEELQTESEYDEVVRRQTRAQEAWERYLRLQQA